MSESACIWPGSSLALAAKAPAAQLGTVNCTTKTVPVFSGTYAAGNSPISVPGDNVWFGAASPNVHRRRTDVVMGSESPEKFLKSAGPYPMSMAGIYSTKPGVIGQLQKIRKSADMVPMAAVGIEPAKVSAESGTIDPGDLLVLSSTPGYAMEGTDRNRILGGVIGKALGRLDSETNVIDIPVTLC